MHWEGTRHYEAVILHQIGYYEARTECVRVTNHHEHIYAKRTF